MQGDLIKMRQASAQVACAKWLAVVVVLAPHCSVLHSPDCCRDLSQVIASQKQMEMKYKQAQQTAVSTATSRMSMRHDMFCCALPQLLLT